MQIEFNIWVILCGSMIVLGIFSSVILLFRKEKFLALLILTISLWLIHTFYSIAGIFRQDADYYFQPIYYSLAFGPLIYFYTKSLTNQKFTFKAKHLVHFIPVLAQAMLYLFLFFQEYNYKNWYWHTWHSPWTYKIEFIGTFVSLAMYTLASLLLLRNYRKWLKNNFSESSKITLNWLRVVLSGFLLLSFFWLTEVIQREVYTVYNDYTAITLGALTLLLTIGGLTQEKSKEISFEPESIKEIEINDEILESVKSRMENNRDFLNPTLTLKDFAKNCELPSRTVSQHINQGLSKTFHDFVNEYRVEEVKKRLANNDQDHYTLESIAYDSGFNSKATFNRIFKKYTGVSPGKWSAK